MNVKNCIRCQQWFAPSDPNQCICSDCAEQLESRAVMYWFIALAVAVISILAYHFLKSQ